HQIDTTELFVGERRQRFDILELRDVAARGNGRTLEQVGGGAQACLVDVADDDASVALDDLDGECAAQATACPRHDRTGLRRNARGVMIAGSAWGGLCWGGSRPRCWAGGGAPRRWRSRSARWASPRCFDSTTPCAVGATSRCTKWAPSGCGTRRRRETIP